MPYACMLTERASGLLDQSSAAWLAVQRTQPLVHDFSERSRDDERYLGLSQGNFWLDRDKSSGLVWYGTE
jgi:hypothetical protein